MFEQKRDSAQKKNQLSKCEITSGERKSKFWCTQRCENINAILLTFLGVVQQANYRIISADVESKYALLSALYHNSGF